MAFSTRAIGSGPDSLVLYISQDAYEGNAQYEVLVDGEQIGTAFTASARRAAGEADTLTLKGDWAAGDHEVEVKFLNDAYGGAAGADRNLHVEGATFNGAAVAGAEQAVMSNALPASFTFNDPSPRASQEFSTAVTWGDEFNGTALDRSKWTLTYGGEDLYWNGAFRWDNTELAVADGSLDIGLQKQSDGIWNVGGLASTPTDHAPGNSFLYGKVEIRAKASQEVDGAGPCFLLWPASNDHWPPEVDILETPHGRGMFTDHWVGPNGEDLSESTFFDVDYSQWHVYGLEWTPNRLTMTVDDKAIRTYTENIPTEAMSIGLQGHVGAANDGWYGSPNGTGVDRLDVSVDYVRMYEYSPLA